MSYTNSTPNYQLPQYIGTDKPTYLIDFNDTMTKIDTGMHNNSVGVTEAKATADSANSTAGSAETIANNALTAANDASKAAADATTIANNATSLAGAASGKADQAVTTANTAANKVDGVLGWKRIVIPNTQLVVNSQFLTATPTTPNVLNGMICFYNDSLKLMQISFSQGSNLTEDLVNLTDHFTVDGINFFPIVQLPFSFDGNYILLKDTTMFYMISGVNQIHVVTPYRNRFAGVVMYNNSAWLCAASFLTQLINVATETGLGAQVWINTLNLGNITLAGWETVTEPTTYGVPEAVEYFQNNPGMKDKILPPQPAMISALSL